ncbi:MAG: DNA polymerase IV [Bacteroidia bacterium]|nr:MAG: DNA polymerase IV [Bacteroidia bacterium]
MKTFEHRNILHLDQDTFFVSVERLRNNTLTHKPVIIGGMGDRGVVASCSYEARRFGVHSAMPMKLARQLCSDAVYIRGDMELYARYSNLVTSIIADQAPLFEKSSIDEHYLDLTGMDRFFGCGKWANELRQTIIRETGLPISMGLSLNKTIAKIATGEAKPNGQLEVSPTLIRPFLDPLSVGKIPMVGPKTYQSLRNMGIATIGTLRSIPPEVFEQMLGKNGKEIWQRANGIDNSPVQSWSEHKSISSETTFDNDVTDNTYINNTLVRLCEELAFRLRKNRQLTGCVSVKLRYANFDTHSLQQSLPYTAFDHILIPACKELFSRLHKRRMRIRLVGVQFSRLIRGAQQLNMFEDTPEMAGLYQAIDRMRRKYGTEAVRRAVIQGIQKRTPESNKPINTPALMGKHNRTSPITKI